MKVQAVIPSGGTGVRLKAGQPKPLVELKGKPIFVYTLEAFEQCSLIDSVILVVHKEYQKQFEEAVARYSLGKVKSVIPGGETRSQSVLEGLKQIDPDTDVVVIHDGVRPLIANEMLEEVVRLGSECDAVTTAVPVKPTIKRVNSETNVVEETLNRDLLWEVQTPQVFKKDIIVRAHETAQDIKSTDDASLVERMGVEVKVFLGNYRNIKITTQEDLVMAEALLKAK